MDPHMSILSLARVVVGWRTKGLKGGYCLDSLMLSIDSSIDDDGVMIMMIVDCRSIVDRSICRYVDMVSSIYLVDNNGCGYVCRLVGKASFNLNNSLV